jgi:hypothetical protein
VRSSGAARAESPGGQPPDPRGIWGKMRTGRRKNDGLNGLTPGPDDQTVDDDKVRRGPESKVFDRGASRPVTRVDPRALAAGAR